MNPRQGLEQYRRTMRAATWPTSGADLFHDQSVIVSAQPAPAVFDTIIMPCLVLRPLGVQSDPDFDEEAGFLKYEMGVTIAQIVFGDAVGEQALLGGPQASVASEGAGLLELEERVLAETEILDALEGFNIQCRVRSAPRADVDPRGRYIAWRDYLFEGRGSSDATFERAGPLVSSVSGTTVTLTWTLPTSRHDISSAVLRRASGSTAPASVTGGTGVTLGSALAVTVDDTPGSGTWSYALFVVYTDGTSASRTATGVVVA